MLYLKDIIVNAQTIGVLKIVKVIKHNLPNDPGGKLHSKRNEAFNQKVTELNLKEVPSRSMDGKGREYINFKPKQED